MVIGFDGSRTFIKERTGTEEYSYQLLKNLAKIDRKNTYQVFLRPHTQIQGNWPDNFYFITIKLPRLWTQAGLAVKTFLAKLDVLFIPAHTLPIIRKPGLKTVVVVHDLGSEYLPKTHQLKQRLYLGLMQKYQLEGATQLIAVSKATKEDLVNKIGIAPKKIAVVYEGYDQNLFKSVKSDKLRDVLKSYGIEKDSYFLFVGTVQPRKNLARLIEAFAEYSSIPHRPVQERSYHKNYDSSKGEFSLRNTPLLRRPNNNLVIVGKKGWLADKIYALPKKLGFEKQVKFLDYVKKEDLPFLYSGAIALVFPSLFEGFGLPILEAQACGCPVITSNISSMPEIAGSGAILVNPYDVDDIVKGMEKSQISNVKSRAAITEQMIKAGFGNIKRFSWEKTARETLEVLEAI